jgi:DDE superfamily endonuclease
MPRTSRRTKAITSLKKVVGSRLQTRQLRTFFLEDEVFEEDIYADYIDLATVCAVENAHGRRYLFRPTLYRKGNSAAIYRRDLNSDYVSLSCATVQSWLNDEEFLSKYRVSRKAFRHLHDLIKDHPVFISKGKKKQIPVEHQLLTWLKYVGTEGTGASNANQRGTFEIGYGTSWNHRRRVTLALRSLASQYIKWPDEEERKEIELQMIKKHDFPHCVMIADGTLFPLAFEPETNDAPDYSGRKYGYSLSTMIFCDLSRRMRHYLAGFPGSAHDNRVYKASRPAKYPSTHYSPREYCIGDSAFENSPHMVSAHKKPRGENIPNSYAQFNYKLAKVRIVSEHCIGILKGRFPWLRNIRMNKDDKKYLKRILDQIEATIVAHNTLVEIGEEERKEWIDEDDFSDLDDAERAPYAPGDILNQGVPDGAPKDERRTRLMHYFEEHHYFA